MRHGRSEMPKSPVCLDASFLIRLLESAEEALPVRLWKAWHEDSRPIVAPALLYYEVASGLRRYVVHGFLRPEHALAALEAALGLDIALYGDADLHLRALEIAAQFGLPTAYDAHYLALGERLGAEFWTADRRLVQAVGETLPWVRLLEAERQG